MELVSFSTLAEMDAAARTIAATERYWLRSERIVCWLAVWLRVKAGVSQERATAEADVCPKSLRRKIVQLKLEEAANWTKAQLPVVARVLREAMRLRRAAKGFDPAPEADAAATAWTDDAEAAAHPGVETLSGIMRGAAAPGAGQACEAVFTEGMRTDAERPAWRDIAHAAQVPPEGAWRTWLLMGGRGAGKTRAGAEWVRELAESGAAKRIALVGPTLHDVREVMIEGVSGIRAVATEGMRPDYVASRRMLVWPDKGACAGAVAMAFSAEDPDALRGPQFDAAWCDEIGAWARDVETWRTLAFAMRLGACPRVVATTTPRPRELVVWLAEKAERGAGGVAMTQAGTRANAANLAPAFVAALEEDFGGTELARRELDGELVSDVEGALWTRAIIEAHRGRLEDAAGLERIVVAVDPPGGDGPNADACGIVAAGVKDGVVYVLADATVRGARPAEWGRRVAAVADAWGAGAVVVEGNVGQALVRDVIRAACGDRVKLVMRHAMTGKLDRAQPVSALYEQGRVRHVRMFKELEDEMCAFGAPEALAGRRARSPDRVDALVWAVDELTRKARGRPRVDIL